MAVTLQDVVRQLNRDEPDYVRAAQLGPEALPHLRQLIEGDDLGLAAKATYLAGIMNADESTRLLEIAARHPRPGGTEWLRPLRRETSPASLPLWP